MIRVNEIVRLFGERIFLLHAGQATPYREFFDRVKTSARELAGLEMPSNRALRLELDWSLDSMTRLIACFQNRTNVFAGHLMPLHGWEPFLEASPLLVLRTAGTTGAPRHVVHSVGRFIRSFALKESSPLRQLILYPADHMAGMDAFMRAIHTGGTLVVPVDRSPRSIAKAIEEERVEALPATPSLLQFLLLSGEWEGRDLSSVKVIPHGAEPMAPALRERLQAAFPRARLRQRFGMTEVGTLPVREDPEDPAALFLDGQPGEYAWRVESGELSIRTPNGSLGTLEEGPGMASPESWFRTGDLAEMTPRGSIRILGRRQFMINVGGVKVIPEEVEALLLEHPNVRDVLVSGTPNPLTGQAVAAQVILGEPMDPGSLIRAVRRTALGRNLPLAYVPTRIEVVDHLEKSPTGKRVRHTLNS